MPTATTFGNLLFSNLGPLTTTFTAPASCSTGPGPLIVATSASPFENDWNNRCGLLEHWPTPGQCVPSGAAVDALYSSNPSMSSTGLVLYYSPGILCPAGWTTAGATTRNTDGSPGSASGAFSFPSPTGAEPSYIPWNAALAQIIDPGETAALCCPSGYSTVPGDALCYAVLPTSVYQPPANSAYCRLLYMYDPETVDLTLTINGHPTSTQILRVPSTASTAEITTTISPARATEFVGVHVVDMIALVHKTAGSPAASTKPAGSLGVPSTGTLGIWPVVMAAILTAGATLMFPL